MRNNAYKYVIYTYLHWYSIQIFVLLELHVSIMTATLC